jgi:hypothetical protein
LNPLVSALLFWLGVQIFLHSTSALAIEHPVATAVQPALSESISDLGEQAVSVSQHERNSVEHIPADVCAN